MIIPNGIIQIDDDAFWHCKNLKNIIIPDSVSIISVFAFYGCQKLESITISPNNSIYHCKNNCIIEKKSKTLIIGCKKSVIPGGDFVTKIGRAAFCRTNVKEIDVPNSVTEIDDYAFRESKINKIIIPGSVLKIGKYVFDGCGNLVIKGESGSYAEKYAKENDIPFEAI